MGGVGAGGQIDQNEATMIRKVSAVISSVFACGIMGGLYGVLLGSLDVALLESQLPRNAEHLTDFVVGAMACGAIFGFPAGFISGVLGASLGGPLGYSIGGLVGTTAVMFVCFGGAGGLRSLELPLACQPSVWGAAFGLVFGWHIKRRQQFLPGVAWLAHIVYGSSLGRWLGWR